MVPEDACWSPARQPASAAVGVHAATRELPGAATLSRTSRTSGFRRLVIDPLCCPSLAPGFSRLLGAQFVEGQCVH